jgi:hypothetical protein
VENAVLCTLDIRFKHQRTRFEAKGKRFVLSIGTLRRALAGLDASTVKWVLRERKTRWLALAGSRIGLMSIVMCG